MCKSLKTDEAQGPVRLVGQFLLRFFERSPARSNHQSQQSGPEQGQRASTVGVSEPTLVLAADRVAVPVHFIFNSPISADLSGHLRGSRFIGSETQGEVARAGLSLAGDLVSSLAMQADQLSEVRIGRRIRFDTHRAQRAFVQETAGAFALGKRGEVESSFCCAKARRLGWLALRAAM